MFKLTVTNKIISKSDFSSNETEHISRLSNCIADCTKSIDIPDNAGETRATTSRLNLPTNDIEDYDKVQTEASLRSQSLFTKWFADSLPEVETSVADGTPSNSNNFFSPEAFGAINRVIHIRPLWSYMLFCR